RTIFLHLLRKVEPVDDEPIGYFLTWTTYGTWLPGDERGGVDGKTHEMHFTGDLQREAAARAIMAEAPISLDREQRGIVEQTIRKHCEIRGWVLHIGRARTNHVHVVLTANRTPDVVMEQFKAWATRHLKPTCPGRLRWWTEKGSKRKLWNDDDLAAA